MELLKAIYSMLCRLAGSRKAFFNIMSNIVSWGLIALLILDWIPEKNQWMIFYIYIADQISTNIYTGTIAFEKIKLEASVRK